MIHTTAIIEDGAVIGQNVQIGPYCVIGSNVTIGDDVKLHAHVVVEGLTTIGEGTEIFSFAVIGSQPQDLKYAGEKSELIIGKNNVIREYATMQPGTKGGGMKTIVGDNCLFMIGTHVAHDCEIGDSVIMANNATLAGHVNVGNHAVIGGLSAVHQFIRIGAFAMIGGMSGVEHDVIPYGLVKGERANLAGLNIVGLSRGGFNKGDISTLQRAVKELFSDDGTMATRMEEIEMDYRDSDLVMNIIKFAKGRTRFPLCAPSVKPSNAA